MENNNEDTDGCTMCKAIVIDGNIISGDFYRAENFINEGKHVTHKLLSRQCYVDWINCTLSEGSAETKGTPLEQERLRRRDERLERAKTAPYPRENCPRTIYETLAQYETPLDFFKFSLKLPILPMTYRLGQTPFILN